MCRERVSYGITTKVEVTTTTTIGVNRSPKRERIFLQKIKFQKVGFLREKFCWEVSKSEICSKKVQSKQATSRNSKIRAKKAVWANCGSWSYVKAEKNPNLKFKSLVWWFRNSSVCSCVGYTENQIFDLLQDELKSPNYHYLPMRVMFNSKFQARPSCCCQFQKVFEFFSWNQINLFHEKFHGLLWNFDVTTTTFKFWKCAESCVSILWLKNSNYPLLATSRGRCLLATSKKIQNSKICTHKIEKIRETATTTIFYPPLVWLSLSRARVNSSVISSSRVVTCITRSSSFILGVRRLAAEEGTFSKKTWLQKI